MGGDIPYTPRVGAEIGGYRLESMLQRGGMSIVYAAEHKGRAPDAMQIGEHVEAVALAVGPCEPV